MNIYEFVGGLFDSNSFNFLSHDERKTKGSKKRRKLVFVINLAKIICVFAPVSFIVSIASGDSCKRNAEKDSFAFNLVLMGFVFVIVYHRSPPPFLMGGRSKF